MDSELYICSAILRSEPPVPYVPTWHKVIGIVAQSGGTGRSPLEIPKKIPSSPVRHQAPTVTNRCSKQLPWQISKTFRRPSRVGLWARQHRRPEARGRVKVR